MAFWNKKSLFDKLNKYFKDNNNSIDEIDEAYSFELSFDKFNLFPYFKLNDDELNIIINLKKDSNLNNKLINEINLKSKFFTLKNKDDILYLEYNTFVDSDNVVDVFTKVISSINEFEKELEKI